MSLTADEYEVEDPGVDEDYERLVQNTPASSDIMEVKGSRSVRATRNTESISIAKCLLVIVGSIAVTFCAVSHIYSIHIHHIAKEEAPTNANVLVHYQAGTVDRISDGLVVHEKKSRHRSKLIDFAIGGFPKCGTTTMMKRLSENPQVFMGGPQRKAPVHEVNQLNKNLQQEFFDLYSTERINEHTNLAGPNGEVLKLKVGFKGPEMMRMESYFTNVVHLFPAIDLVLSLRHPVLHFESNYNFRLRYADPDVGLELVKTKDLIGNCGHDCKDNCTPKFKFIMKESREHTSNAAACTYSSTFQYGLSRLSLTPMESDELALLDHHQLTIHPEWSGRLFLMETGQIADKDQVRHRRLERSFEDFLGIEANSFTTDETAEEKSKYQSSQKFIHICDDEHKEVRNFLVEHGAKGAHWIKHYLLESDSSHRIVVPNKEHFIELIDKWGVDPCDKH